MIRALEAHYAKERIRLEQQGFGKPIIAARFNDYQIVAVGKAIHWSKKANTQTFSATISSASSVPIGAMPNSPSHSISGTRCCSGINLLPILGSHDQNSRRGDSAEITGVVACYLGTAYSLYLLDHNVELQARIIRRLKNPRDFQGAYYELIVANALIRAGFKLTLEDETDPVRQALRIRGRLTTLRKKILGRGENARCGRSAWEGPQRRHPEPQSDIPDVPHLNGALAKPAAGDRLIFIDLNTDAALGADGKPTWAQSSLVRLEQFERRELVAGVTAYVFISNVPFHRMLSERLHTALAPFGIWESRFQPPRLISPD